VDFIAAEDRAGRAAGDDPLHRPAPRDAPTVLVDQLAQGNPHRQLVDTGIVDMAAQAVELGAAVPLGADRAEPLPAALHDVRHARQGLHVVHDGRAAEEPYDRREGRLETRPPALSLERFDEPGLFTADVGARAHVHRDLARPAGAQDIPADEARPASLLDGFLEQARLVRELPPDVDVGAVRPDRVGAAQRSLQKLVPMLPMHATVSATMRPTHMSSSACRLMNDGGRTRVLWGIGPPSLTT